MASPRAKTEPSGNYPPDGSYYLYVDGPGVECPECGSNNGTSDGYVSSWLLGWSNTLVNGVQHSHNPNRYKQSFKCENGHHYDHVWWSQCSWCDYVAGTERCQIFKDMTKNVR